MSAARDLAREPRARAFMRKVDEKYGEEKTKHQQLAQKRLLIVRSAVAIARCKTRLLRVDFIHVLVALVRGEFLKFSLVSDVHLIGRSNSDSFEYFFTVFFVIKQITQFSRPSSRSITLTQNTN
jgi:hypothetical protein